MERNSVFPGSTEGLPGDRLRQFVDLFERKGWLNRHIRLQRGSRRYRLSCGEAGFHAYRINDHHGLSPGVPGWPVCIITQEGILQDAEIVAFASTEPSVEEWLHCLAENDFELISEVP